MVRPTIDGPVLPLPATASSTGTVSGDDVDWDTGPLTPALALDDLTDVDAPTPADQDVLTWDDYLQEWIPAAGSGLDVELVTVADAGPAETIDVSVARTYDLTLTEDCTLTLTGAVTAEAWFVTVLLRQGGAGGWEVTWPGSVEWPGGVTPTLATDPGAVDVFALFTLDGGTTWFGFPTGGSGVTFGTPAIVLGTAAAAGSTDEAIRRDATIVAFDATAPVTLDYEDIAAAGSAAVAARRDHVHGMPAAGGGIGQILISDTPSTPIVFADLLQNEAQDDLLYADP